MQKQELTGLEWKMPWGHFVIGTRNENGELLLEFCANNDMVVGGTLFQHKNIHKYTWTNKKYDRPHYGQQQMGQINAGVTEELTYLVIIN